MALPRQVEQQLAEVDDIEKRMAEPEAQPEELPEEQPGETPAAVPEPAPQRDVDWEHKYRTLQGMYDAEVPRLHQQVKELSRRLDEVASKPVQEPAAKPQLVTNDDVETFGQDLIDVQRRVAKEVFEEHVIPLQKQLAEVKQENDQLRNSVKDTDARTVQTSFDTRLHRLVPDFESLNRDPAWVAWLSQVDPILRAPRRAVAQQAFNAGDAEGVAHYVNLFRNAASTTQSTKQRELERQVAPARNASPSTTTATGKTYSTTDVERAFQKVATLNKLGKFDEANKLEAELTQAYADGRVLAT